MEAQDPGTYGVSDLHPVSVGPTVELRVIVITNVLFFPVILGPIIDPISSTIGAMSDAFSSDDNSVLLVRCPACLETSRGSITCPCTVLYGEDVPLAAGDNPLNY